MKDSKIKIKLSYITGLKFVVLDELDKHPEFCVVYEEDDSILTKFASDAVKRAKDLRSVARAYIVIRDDGYNPLYISKHKSILSNLIDATIKDSKEDFKNFKITCAGSDSSEVRDIVKYINETYKLIEKEEADLKIHIIKLENTWEIGIQITPRPLSLRSYKVAHISGAMDPTVAYAVNSFCKLDKAESYLNIFSGSGTLLIEAAQCYSNLNKIIGFDYDKQHLSSSIHNIRNSGLIEKIEVKEANIFNKPDFGKFDAIASDLPFGMAILKNEDLHRLYKVFIEYCEVTLNSGGRLVAYTSEHGILEPIIAKSKFKIIKSLDLRFLTSVDAYLRPKIIVCEFK